MVYLSESTPIDGIQAVFPVRQVIIFLCFHKSVYKYHPCPASSESVQRNSYGYISLNAQVNHPFVWRSPSDLIFCILLCIFIHIFVFRHSMPPFIRVLRRNMQADVFCFSLIACQKPSRLLFPLIYGKVNLNLFHIYPCFYIILSDFTAFIIRTV